ncbi:threonine-phosphate decarboxylase CobD [Synechocystis sp. PCC 7509]|uniref:threonine-phosphate decarboxylase CobD n=1 Tax=Synechocystis sp. PCC 7509 TaxID=927677 RepID=UPI0002ABCA09|nr:threonine-phosphate decarboxylase CobD [Synechocystis sp. PCC 7509]
MSQPGHGGNLAWAAAMSGCPADAIVDFSASISPLGPPASAISAIVANLANLSHYPDPDYWELRTAIGKLHQLSPDWILPGNGSAELLTWAGWDLATLAVTALVTPAFGDYRRSLEAFNANIHQFPIFGQQKLDSAYVHCDSTFLLSEQSSLHSYSPLERGLLLNNPHNPSGKLFLLDSIAPYLEEFALVVVDEAFMDFLPPEQQQSLIPLVEKYPNLVILRSLTKFYSLPGLRMGYAISHPDRLKLWQSRRDPWSVGTLAAAAAIAIIQDTAFQQQTWDWLPTARDWLFTSLSQLPGLTPWASAANFLLVHSNSSVKQLQERLLQQHRILIRDCLSFPELGDSYFRVAVKSQCDNEQLVKAIAQSIIN